MQMELHDSRNVNWEEGMRVDERRNSGENTTQYVIESSNDWSNHGTEEIVQTVELDEDLVMDCVEGLGIENANYMVPNLSYPEVHSNPHRNEHGEEQIDNDNGHAGEENMSPDSDSTDDSDKRATSSQVWGSDEEDFAMGDTSPLFGTVHLPEPRIGMEFDDEHTAYIYYNTYAKEKGFSVRKGRVERSRIDKRVLSRAFVCSNEGKKYTNDKRRQGIDYTPRVTKKTNCPATMRIRPVDGKWVVDIFFREHNHQLVDPRDSFRLRSHQKASKGTVELIERLHRCGVTPSQVFTILKDFASGEQHAGISDVRFRSLFRAKRRSSLGIDCQLAIKYLNSMKITDPNFFYSVNVNKDHELTGMFWVDGRAREQYRVFGDVMVFDTTYRKNKYKFPFAPFTGVNHHMQCILFGCGLIADETQESFVWLFSSWLQSMHNTPPKSILTDEDPGIMRAVKKVFPTTVHRLCLWHLEKHRLNHMAPLYRKYPDLKQVFYKCVHSSATPTEFENNWDAMIQRFGLQGHKWLRKKFKKRQHWVPCYFPNTFFAGMTTTQRAESMNNYFKGYFSSSTPMNEFITQYEEALRRRRGLEAKADVNCLTTKPTCCTMHPLEKQATDVYTSSVFKVFKEEWKLCLAVEVRECIEDPPIKRYETVFKDISGHDNVQIVIDDVDSEVTTCTCKMFEHIGVLCKHILKVYVISDRRRIPDAYIMFRWTKAARYGVCGVESEVCAPAGQPQQPVWVLHDLAHRLVNEGGLSQERYHVAYEGLNNSLRDVLELDVSIQPDTVDNTQQSSSMNATGNVPQAIDPRTNSVTRGRPIQSRIIGTVEHLRNKRSYRCSACGLTGHNVVKCHQVNAANSDANIPQNSRAMQIDLNDPSLNNGHF